MLSISNYDIIEKITDTFMTMINEEMSKNKAERLSNDAFMNKVWDSYSNDKYINNTLRRKINVDPVQLGLDEIRWIDDNDILSLKFTVVGTTIENDFTYRELCTRQRFIMAKAINGNIRAINSTRFKLDVEEGMRVLKSRYLREGIKMNHDKLLEEATINVCNLYGIQYNDNH